jgi:hypothetical protein
VALADFFDLVDLVDSLELLDLRTALPIKRQSGRRIF